VGVGVGWRGVGVALVLGASSIGDASAAMRLTVQITEHGAQVLYGRPVEEGPLTQQGTGSSASLTLRDPRVVHAEWLDGDAWVGSHIGRSSALLTVDVSDGLLGRRVVVSGLRDVTSLDLPAVVPAPPSMNRDGIEVRTLLDSGPSEVRQDLVFLAEAYTEDERERFFGDVRDVLAAMDAIEPHDRYLYLANVHAVFTPSEQSGADHPETEPAVERSTALHCTYGGWGVDRLIACSDAAVLALAGEAPGEDVRIVLVNDLTYGGTGGAEYAVSFNGAEMERVAIHEMAHSDAALADEYSYGVPNPGVDDGAVPNCSASPTETSWEAWREIDGVDAFPVCAYTDWFRPTFDACLMNVLQDQYCPACRERLVQRAWEHVDTLLLGQSPTEATVLARGEEVTLSIDTVQLPGEPMMTRWTVDGEVWAEGGDTLTLRWRQLSNGDHAVRVEVWDDTEAVRGERPASMSATAAFAVTVDPGACGCERPGTGRAMAVAALWLLPLGRRRRRGDA